MTTNGPAPGREGAAGEGGVASPAATSPSEGGAPVRGRIRTLLRDLLAFDRRALVILAYVPIALTAIEYLFITHTAYKRPPPAWVGSFLFDLRERWPSIPQPLLPWLWWSAGCLVLLVLVPMLLLRVVAGTGPRETGLRIRGTGREAWTYLGLYVLFVPVVWWVSQRPDFRATYPFYRVYGKYGWDLVAFEAAYFLQFLAVEYFFRGFLVLGLKPTLGRASILVMLAPYCMIHFHKPMLEAFGAIGAGLVLGCLSWRARTVVWGWFLHYGVALTMDLLSLKAAGRL
jgi:hypothetical protein